LNSFAGDLVDVVGGGHMADGAAPVKWRNNTNYCIENQFDDIANHVLLSLTHISIEGVTVYA
jgi:hypothetical protein